MFTDVVENNDRLESFDISWNHINGRSAEAFAKGVKVTINFIAIFLALYIHNSKC